MIGQNPFSTTVIDGLRKKLNTSQNSY